MLTGYILLAQKIFPVLFLAAAFFYFFKKNKEMARYSFLIYGIIIFRFIYAGVLTKMQYALWLDNDFTRYLLPPHQPIRYFIGYAWTHFWLGAVISVGMPLIVFLFFVILRKIKKEALGGEEAGIIFLTSLVAGWPNIIIFLPLAFIFALLTAVFRKIFLKDDHISVSLPFLLAALIIILFGDYLFSHIGLPELKI